MTAPPAARAMQGLSNRRALTGCLNVTAVTQTCAVRRDTERLMIGQSLSLIYAEGHTHTHSVGYNETAIHYIRFIISFV